MNLIDELTEYFRKFPGVGPKQASRFVYYLLRNSNSNVSRISQLIGDLKSNISQCVKCNRNFILSTYQSDTCNMCSDPSRDNSQLMIIENDTDLEAVNKNDIYNGKFFIIGSLIKILEEDYHSKHNLNKLTSLLNNDPSINEIIFALDATPDGENTINIFKKEINNKISDVDNREIKLTVLGRGLSTGTEIEYTDSETLRNALNGRG